MRSIKCIFALLLLNLWNSVYAQSNKTIIGMTKNELKKAYANLDTTDKNTFIRIDSIYGFSSEWGYRFNADTLTWIFFHKTTNAVNKKEFAKYLFATKKVINYYTKVYGKPDTTIIGIQKFINPLLKKHYGYDVIEARWKNYKGMKIKAQFRFMGGKELYFFDFSINYGNQSYPYYD